MSYPIVDRLRRAPETLGMGLRTSIVGSMACVAAAALGRDLTDPEFLWMLTITAMITTILSPLQDHMRRLLHISDLSWRAATVSIVQFGVTAASLTVMWLVDVPVALMPFGSACARQRRVLTVGLVLGKVFDQEPLARPASILAARKRREVAPRPGRHPVTCQFAVAAIVAAIAGATILGYAEAARVVAQPVLVFATGLTAVLAPRAMRSAMDVDISVARQTRGLYLGLMSIAGMLYLVWASQSGSAIRWAP